MENKNVENWEYERCLNSSGLVVSQVGCIIYSTRSLGARWALTSSWRPFEPAFCPSGILEFVLRALRPLRPRDPRTDAGIGNIR